MRGGDALTCQRNRKIVPEKHYRKLSISSCTTFVLFLNMSRKCGNLFFGANRHFYGMSLISVGLGFSADESTDII